MFFSRVGTAWAYASHDKLAEGTKQALSSIIPAECLVELNCLYFAVSAVCGRPPNDCPICTIGFIASNETGYYF